MSWVSDHVDGARIDVFAVPRASRTEIVGEHDGRLRIRLAAPPVDGAANKELVRFFAQSLNLAKSAVSVAQGTTGRRKTIVIEGRSATDIRQLLAR